MFDAVVRVGSSTEAELVKLLEKTFRAVNIGLINELCTRINDVLGTDIDPIYDDPRPGDVRHSMADVTKASSELGYELTVEFQEGLERTVEWFE